MPHFNSFNFYQNMPKIFIFAKKIQNLSALSLRTQTPVTAPLLPFADFWLHAGIKL